MVFDELVDVLVVELPAAVLVWACVWVLGLVPVIAFDPVMEFEPVIALEPDIVLDEDMVLLLAGAFAAACAKAAPLNARQHAIAGTIIFTERIVISLEALLFERARSIVR